MSFTVQVPRFHDQVSDLLSHRIHHDAAQHSAPAI